MEFQSVNGAIDTLFDLASQTSDLCTKFKNAKPDIFHIRGLLQAGNQSFSSFQTLTYNIMAADSSTIGDWQVTS